MWDTTTYAGLAQTNVLGWVLGTLLGAAIVGVVVFVRAQLLQKSLKKQSDEILENARREADTVVKAAQVEAKAEFLAKQDEFAKETAQVRSEFKETEKRLAKREDGIDQKLDTLATKERMLDSQEGKLAERQEKITERESELTDIIGRQRDELMRISDMNRDEATRVLLERIEQEIEHDAAKVVHRRLSEAKEEAESKAREIIITAIQRYSAEQTAFSTVSTVDIPSDEMKGRVIGREGRNIRAFERAAAVEVIVDDTPGVVVVSAFDPVRKEVGRRALERLIQDGRIHPGRIEEVVQETQEEVQKELMEIGKRASVEANIGGLHKKIIELLGRLHYRTSYGQNVLRHSIEVAFLCQIMAEELGLDGKLARRCGLLHDIGKAVDVEEVDGPHPQVGYDICKRFKEAPEVLNAVLGHHGDVEATSVYTPLVTAADAISASRPGSRRESLERYIKRLEQLESLATAQNGVRQAFAIQAGREVRVIVDPGRVDDAMATKIAHDIAKNIEQEMTYPGEIRVTVLREVRAVGIAQ